MNYSKNDTMIAKGFAAILLLIHHLFYTTDYAFSSFLFSREGWVNLAKISKVCVAMFLILSGYGLAKSFEKHQLSSFSFVKRHLLKVYTGFWMIFALSLIPLCFAYKGKTFGSTWVDGIQFIEDFLGIRLWFGEYGYNPTWWFLSLIIPLYILFPLLYKSVQKKPVELLLASFFIFLLGGIFKYSFCWLLKTWSFPFVLGIFSAKYDLFDRIKKSSYPGMKTCLFILLIGLCALRLRELKLLDAGAMLIFDGLTAFVFIAASYVFINAETKIARVGAFIGKNSMNIFLMHTFVFFTYFQKFSYSLKYPPLILLQLLLICLAFSVILEKTKEMCLQILKRGKKNLSP